MPQPQPHKQQNRPRMGELLGQLVPLSGHDVDEILHEQDTSERRFGEIALSWGLCQPEHVWSAWCRQVRDGGVDLEHVDLDQVGIDAQAAEMLPGDAARIFRAVPVRAGEAEVVVASAEPLGERTRAVLRRLLRRHVTFLLAPAEQVDAAIIVYYPE